MGGGAPWPTPDEQRLVDRIQRTEPEQLRGTARVFDGVAGECERVAGRMAGVRSATADFWRGGSERGFVAYARTVESGLADAASAVREMATHLRAHAAATDEAQTGLRAASGMLGVDAGEAAAAAATRATVAFHASEQRVRQALWTLGAAAPGGIPLPMLLPAPPPHGWRDRIDPEPLSPQFWIDSAGLPVTGVAGAYRPGLFGYDEDGHLVPAYEADPMAEQFTKDEARVVNLVDLAELGLESRPSATRRLTEQALKSTKFTSRQINKHIRELYNLPKWKHGEPKTVPGWAHDEFVALFRLAMADHGRVFHWSVKGKKAGERQPTFAFMYRDVNTKKYLAVQFYDLKGTLGGFATAFWPNPRQEAAMLEAEWVRR